MRTSLARRPLHWRGELQMREAQSYAWQKLPLQVVPVLPGTIPVLKWFAEERGFTGATHSTAGQTLS